MKVTFSNLEQFLTNATTTSDLPVLLGVAEESAQKIADEAYNRGFRPSDQ